MKVADKLKALRIKVNLIADEKVGLMEINAEVYDGLAILTGEVENVEGSFGETAFSLSGSEEFPGPGAPTSEQFPGQFTDAEIDEEIHDRLAAEPEIDTSKIEYATNNQIVHLSGFVRTQEDLNKLLDIVTNVRGVMGIDSDVKVEQGEVGTPIE